MIIILFIQILDLVFLNPMQQLTLFLALVFSVNSPTICSGQTASLIAMEQIPTYGLMALVITLLQLYQLYSNTIYTVTGSNGFNLQAQLLQLFLYIILLLTTQD